MVNHSGCLDVNNSAGKKVSSNIVMNWMLKNLILMASGGGKCISRSKRKYVL